MFPIFSSWISTHTIVKCLFFNERLSLYSFFFLLFSFGGGGGGFLHPHNREYG